MTAPKMELRRAEEAAPTEPGWYYAKPAVSYLADNPEIVCVENAMVYWNEEWRNIDDFKWFGPVPTCAESGS
jgi:hypothetical protein